MKDVAVAVTGVAGPEPDEDGNPVRLVFCSVARSTQKPVIGTSSIYKNHFPSMQLVTTNLA
ncbi:MAG: CinA family protein [Hyphomicrobiales bacterium]